MSLWRRVGLAMVALAMVTTVVLAVVKAVRNRSASSIARTATAAKGSVARNAPTAPSSYVGVLLPPQMANLASRADGKLVSVPVRVGQQVKKGDVLAVFDARERQQELAMAEASLKAAQGTAAAAGADLVAAKHRAARRTATVDVGGQKVSLVSGEEAAQSVADSHSAAGRATTAAAQVSEQRAKIAQLRIALDECELRAPFEGIVTAIYFEPGANAHANETVVRVVGGGRGLRVRFAVPEEDHGVLREVHHARVVLDAQRSFSAVIDRISPEVEASSRTFFVEGSVEVQESCRDCALLAGRTVRGMFVN